MREKKPLWIKIYGIALIVLSIAYLLNLSKCVIAYRDIQSIIQFVNIFVNIEDTEFLQSFIPISLALPVIAPNILLIGFLSYLIAGIGILKLKLWARYLILLLAISILVNLMWTFWLFGPHMRSVLFYILWTLISVFTILFFNRQNIKEKFGVGLKKINLVPKILLGLLSVAIFLQLLSMPLFTLYMKIASKKLPPAVNAEVEEVTYQAKYSELKRNNYEKRILFGYSIYLPKDIIVSSVREGGESWNWEVRVIDKVKNKKAGFVLLLSSKNFGEWILFPVGKHFNFKSPYEFEKALSSPGWMRFYSVLKLYGTLDSLKRTEEGISSDWKGFIRIGHSEKHNKWIFDCSLYDNDYKSSAGILLIFKDEIMTLNQAKNMIASLKFETDDKDEFEFFDQGKKALSNGDYSNAIIDFTNALYANKQSSQYAYYLARALFEDDSEIYRKWRLGSSKDFLEYALNLNPNYKEAKKLLTIIDEEINALEKEETK